MALASSFAPGEASSVNAASQGSAGRRMNNPPVCPRHTSDHCFHTVYPPVVCLASLQKQSSALQTLPQPSPLTFKTPGFKPHWLQELTKFSTSCFPNQCLWGSISLCIHLCASLSLALLCDHSPFPQKHSWSASSLNHISALPTFFECGLFSPFSCSYSSVNLQADFCGI